MQENRRANKADAEENRRKDRVAALGRNEIAEQKVVKQAEVVEKKAKVNQESNMVFLSQLLTIQEESNRHQETEAIRTADH